MDIQFKHFNERSSFDALILTNTGLTDVSEALNNVNNGCYYAICFIKDTGEIYTHGRMYSNLSNYYTKDEVDGKISQSITDTLNTEV